MTRPEIQRRAFLALLASMVVPVHASAPVLTFQGSRKWNSRGIDFTYQWVDAIGTPGVKICNGWRSNENH